MEWNILKSLVYGLMMGLTEFLPVSSDAHNSLFLQLTGSGSETGVFRLICHFFGFLVLIFMCYPAISRMRREKRIASMPMRRRKRQPDPLALLDIRVLKTMITAACLTAILALMLRMLFPLTVLTPVFLVINGILLFLCRVRPTGNKDSRSFSGLDAILTGGAIGLGCMSGMSPLAMGLAFACLRGGGRKYACENTLCTLLAVLAVMMCFDVISLVGVGAVFSLRWIACYIGAAIAASVGAYLGIVGLRFLIVKTDFAGFAYYCWGFALFMIALYLIV